MNSVTDQLPKLSSTILIPREDESVASKLDVFYCLDDNFCLPTGIAALSVLKNNPSLPLTIHFVGIDVSEENIDYFKRIDCPSCSEVIFHLLSEKDCSKFTAGRASLHFPPANFVRIFLPKLFPNLKKILYLDGDTLCVGSIKELADLPLNENFAGVVLDVPPKKLPKNQALRKDFNAGMLLINVEAYNKADMPNKIISIMENNPQYNAPDQMALNDAFGDKKKWLDGKFNFIQEISIGNEDDSQRVNDSAIIHYANRSKPWTLAFTTKLYDKYYLSSPWKDFPKELVYKNDPNSLKKYALWLFRKNQFSKSLTVWTKYIKVLIERKKNKFSKKFSQKTKL